MTMQLDSLPFAKLMGVTVVSIAPDLVIGELKGARGTLHAPRRAAWRRVYGLR